jgi:multidrug efflux pump subunit AcrA (membrane-fusion protein)
MCPMSERSFAPSTASLSMPENVWTTGELIRRILQLEEQGERDEARIAELEGQAAADLVDLASMREQTDIDQALIAELKAQAVIDQAQIANLQIALNSARRIGAALGIIMASYKVTEEKAFATLRIASQHTHRKLRDVAEDVLLTGAAPPDSH